MHSYKWGSRLLKRRQLSLPAVSEVEDYVRQKFDVINTYHRESGAYEFTLAPGQLYGRKFVELFAYLRSRNFIPLLRESDSSLTLLVEPYQFPLRQRVNLPLLLFAATLISVSVDGWLRSSALTGILTPAQVTTTTLIYALTLMAIIGTHEGGHYLVSRMKGQRPSLPYFIPGVPGFLPTFGALIVSTEPSVNRDAEFDLGASGPLAGLIVSIVALFVGLLDTKVVPLEFAKQVLGSNISIITQVPVGLEYLVGAFQHPGPNDVVIFSPILFAAWFGFLLTFLNLMPAGQLDGGHMSSSILTRKGRQLATLLSVFAMLLLGYFLMAVFIFALSWGNREVRPLDDVTRISKNRVFAFAAVLALATLIYVLFLYPPIY